MLATSASWIRRAVLVAGAGVATTSYCLARPAAAAAATDASTHTHSAAEQAEFDVYVKNPKVHDLRPLVAHWQAGREVWPWVWTWRNIDGPHHVFVGANADTVVEVHRLAKADHRNNIMIVGVPAAQLAALAQSEGRVSGFWNECRCGVIESEVALMDVKAKIMMLDDERILCFDHCTIVAPPEPGAPGTAL
ncbi:hypothetical protein T484DRAFT_1844489 [Baffinella frigidus]|nr:hypothetical protein T484DRAFT_1844489 [Cryptophyta sp. CCMP2293]